MCACTCAGMCVCLYATVDLYLAAPSSSGLVAQWQPPAGFASDDVSPGLFSCLMFQLSLYYISSVCPSL